MKYLTIALILALSVMLVACGGSEAPAAESAAPAEPAPAEAPAEADDLGLDVNDLSDLESDLDFEELDDIDAVLGELDQI